MINVTTDISLDIRKMNSEMKKITVKQGDYGTRALRVTLTDNGNPVLLKRSNIVRLNAKRNDGTTGSTAGTVGENGNVEFLLNEWMLSRFGKLLCDVSVVNEGEDQISSEQFVIYVQMSAGGNRSEELERPDETAGITDDDIVSAVDQAFDTCVGRSSDTGGSHVFDGEETTELEISKAVDAAFKDYFGGD